MPSGDLRYQSIDDLLRWIESAAASGALEVGRGPGPLRVFFHAGKITFADQGNQPPTLAEIDGAGIDRDMWKRALSRPEARASLSASLLAEGVPRDAVEAFAVRRITLAVEGLRKLWAGRFVTTDAVHPFGTAAAIDVARVYRSPRLGDGPGGFEAILALAPSDRFQVTLNGQDWTALAALLPPLRYSDLVDRLGQEVADHLFATLQRAELAQIVPADLAAMPERGHEQPPAGAEEIARDEDILQTDGVIGADLSDGSETTSPTAVADAGDAASLVGLGLPLAELFTSASQHRRSASEQAGLPAVDRCAERGFPLELLEPIGQSTEVESDIDGDDVPDEQAVTGLQSETTLKAPFDGFDVGDADVREFLLGPVSPPWDESVAAEVGDVPQPVFVPRAGDFLDAADLPDADTSTVEHEQLFSSQFTPEVYGTVDELLNHVLPFPEGLGVTDAQDTEAEAFGPSTGDSDGPAEDPGAPVNESSAASAAPDPVAIEDPGDEDRPWRRRIPKVRRHEEDADDHPGFATDPNVDSSTSDSSKEMSNAYGEGAYGLVADLRRQMDVPPEAQPSTLKRLITAITRL